MADGSGSGPLAGPVRGGILRDPVDLRDRAYEPTLARLAPQLLPDARLLAALRKRRRYWNLPRQQGDEGTCGGQALAALIDLERLRSGHRRCTSVSARMLYQTARLKYDPGRAGGRVAARRDQGLLQLRRLQREALALRRRASSRRARSTSSARARRATSPSAPTTGCGRTSTPTTRRCTRPARCWSRPSCTTAGCPSGSRRRRARSCRRSPASARRRSEPRTTPS